MKQVRKIYDLDYYKVQLIIDGSKFKKFVNELISKFTKFGCPIPNDGFKGYKEYLQWNDKYFNKRAEIESSEEFKDKICKITGSKNRWGRDEQDKIDELKDRELPPIYGEAIKELLIDRGVQRGDKNYDSFKDFVMQYIFFNKREFTNSPLIIKWQRNDRLKENELLIKILPNTRKEDLEKIWPIIKEEQKDLPNFKIKNKQYKNFHRDLEIYNIYKNLRKNPTSKYKKAKCPLNKRADYETAKIIREKYGISSWGTIRYIVNNIEKLKKSVGFKEPH